jgi:hypothetical protein
MASHLPFSVRQMLRSFKYQLEFAAGCFRSDEPEFHELATLLQLGDWVLDVGEWTETRFFQRLGA